MQHNYLKIFVENNLLYKGQVLIYLDNHCEGILDDQNNEKNYVSGIFEQFKYLNLEVVTKNKREVFEAQKTYLKYEGKYKVIEDERVIEAPFYLTVSSLNVDPRDYVGDNPTHLFLEELNIFKKEKDISFKKNDIAEEQIESKKVRIK